MEIYIINNKPTVHMSLDELNALCNKEKELKELKEELHKYKSEHGHYMSKCKKLEEENETLKVIKEIADALPWCELYKAAELKDQNKRLEEENQILQDKLAAIEEIIEGES